jgi:hypothetical protein
MASLQEQLVTQLAGIAAGRLYPMVAPDGAVRPYLVYQRIANTVNNVLSGNGNPPIDNTRFQVDVWADSYGSAQATAGAVKAAMLAWSLQNVLLQEADQYESQTHLYRVLQDYSVWSG